MTTVDSRIPAVSEGGNSCFMTIVIGAVFAAATAAAGYFAAMAVFGG